MKKALAITLTLIMAVLAFASCVKQEKGLWKNADFAGDFVYRENGGDREVAVKITAEGKTVTARIYTAEQGDINLGELLGGHGIIRGEEGPYGLYITEVNGMEQKYEIHGKYWAFYVNGKLSPVGVDSVTVKDSEEYEFKAE